LIDWDFDEDRSTIEKGLNLKIAAV